jgi:ribosome-binding protein aMBF1 (putative translation factor)
MPAKPDKEFVRRFGIVVRQAREAAGFSPAQMALKLGLGHKTYRNYETKSALPAHLIPQFCAHVNVTLNDLFMRIAELKS